MTGKEFIERIRGTDLSTPIKVADIFEDQSLEVLEKDVSILRSSPIYEKMRKKLDELQFNYIRRPNRTRQQQLEMNFDQGFMTALEWLLYAIPAELDEIIQSKQENAVEKKKDIQ